MEIEKKKPTWHGLPDPFKTNLVDHLDYKSRCCLRKVSRADKELVDRCPVVLQSIIIEPPKNETITSARLDLEDLNAEREERPEVPPQLAAILAPMLDDDEPRFRIYHQDEIIHDAVLPLAHPKSSVSLLQFYRPMLSAGPPKHIVEAFFRKLMNHMQSFPNFGIRTKKLKWHWRTETNTEFLEVLRLCDPTELKILEWFDVPFACIADVIQTEQWKNLKYISIIDHNNIAAEHFFNCEKAFLYQRAVRPPTVSKLIRNFISKNPRAGSFVRIYSDWPFSEPEVMRDLVDFPAVIHPAPGHTEAIPFVPTRVRYYELATEEHVLVVGFESRESFAGDTREMRAVVCRRDNIGHDFLTSVDYRFPADYP